MSIHNFMFPPHNIFAIDLRAYFIFLLLFCATVSGRLEGRLTSSQLVSATFTLASVQIPTVNILSVDLLMHINVFFTLEMNQNF